MLDHETALTSAAWPDYDPEVARAQEIVVPVQVNGKLRGRLTVPADTSEQELERLALADPAVRHHIDGKTVKKVVVAQGRLVSVVVQ
jgi:leucyl-tRNA synthetase